MMRGSTTIFTVKDAKASLAYYRDCVGFDVAFEYGTPTFYVGLCSGEVSPAPDRGRAGAAPTRPCRREHLRRRCRRACTPIS